MNSEAQQFCLRWHNYSTSLLASLPRLLDWDDLTDVTLYAGGLSVKAHRIVLSACSQYFKAIFKELGPTQHPVIVVPGADFSDLSALVTFMYSGEVTVYRHQLPSLIALADTLSVDGLAHFGKCEDDSPQEPSNPGFVGHVDLPSPGSHRFGPAKRFKAIDDWSEDGPSSGAVLDSPPCLVPSPTKTMYVRKAPQSRPIPAVAPLSPPEDLSHKPCEVAVKSEDGGGGGTTSGPPNSSNSRAPTSKLYATCAICSKQLSNQYNLRVHMETHRGARYACASCPHVSRSRDALRKHVSYRHPPPSQNQQPPQQPTGTAVPNFYLGRGSPPSSAPTAQQSS
ncbi:BTB/POZ domain [Nesidiocoris tenuis]|uniref:BTB/POZ domain n=1 Tax=Nesidiocoris tenuis TaxID=355587 RepID=A0ABN7BCD8_9HEMI|nr:BTB/POZ domain [Nesidiocoris tenuis]